MRLAGSVVLVTGASSGIGRCVAADLAGAGATVIVTGRDPARLRAVSRETGVPGVLADLSRPGAGARLAERVLERWGRVDALVCNAGVGWAGDVAGMPESVLDRLLQVNLRAPIDMTRVLLPGMREQGGHLLYVTSIAGRLGVAGEAVYAATKAALDVFAHSLRLELRGRPVRVSTVVPGVVDTEFFDRRGRAYERRIPRPMPPGRAAAAVVRALRHDRAEAYLPGWLRLPVAVRALLPAVYDAMAGRFG
ncbi:SDR family NAD(P)-dependent oxidoreductase [Dactylosporangium sp. CA-139066]|uniref:SDR family NAD(P)-dependent oxidoreductase n=1 Tax=Dactylosporangium sp. CA-139066 TaxID=3239930 RepID=UPI003D902227